MANVQRRQDEIAALARGKASPTPRAIRVLRKRLRSLNLWPTSFDRLDPDKSDVLTRARALAAPEDRAFFDPLTAYDAWIEVNRPTEASRADLREALRGTLGLPKLSIVTPVYNTPSPLLSAMVDSVFGQIYENWELCIADDASAAPETQAYLATLEARDPRVRITRRPRNGGISEASNSAAALATGEVLVFVDHDDLITEDCLAEIALYYARRPDADIVYTDDDKIDMDGRRFAPQFKPDWSPTLLLSYMYMSHTLTVRRGLFESLGGFRKAFDGSQDYDFALRAAEKAAHIGHIPRILYHWRATPVSTASSGAAKPESFLAGQRAVQEAIDRRGLRGTVAHPDWAREANVGMFAVSFPDNGPSVTIIIPTFNQAALLRDCLAALTHTTYANYDVLVVDNGSDDPATLVLLAEIGSRQNHRVTRIPKVDGVFSFAALMNTAVDQATGDLVLLLNDDTRVINPAWLSQMVGYQSMEGVGSVGARLYFEDGSIQHAGIVHGFNDGLVGHAFRGAPNHSWGYMGFIRTAREYSAVTAACVLTPRALFQAVGGFDAENFAVAYNDFDYGFRLFECGLRNIYCP
ncbi:N/A [soil metagenome]